MKSSCMKKSLLNETLKAEILLTAFMESAVDCHANSYHISVFGYFGRSNFRFKKLNSLSGNHWTFYKWRNINWYPDGRHASSCFGKQKVWFWAENISFFNFWFFWPSRFPIWKTLCKIMFRKDVVKKQNCWIRPRCEKFQSAVMSRVKKDFQLKHTSFQVLAISQRFLIRRYFLLKLSSSEILQIGVCWLTLWLQKSRTLFWKEASLFTKTNLANLHLLTMFAYKVSVLRIPTRRWTIN